MKKNFSINHLANLIRGHSFKHRLNLAVITGKHQRIEINLPAEYITAQTDLFGSGKIIFCTQDGRELEKLLTKARAIYQVDPTCRVMTIT